MAGSTRGLFVDNIWPDFCLADLVQPEGAVKGVTLSNGELAGVVFARHVPARG